MSLKKIAADWLPPRAFQLLKKLYLGKYQGKDGLDKKMEKFINYDGGTFVELGANDGFVQSNTYYFEKSRKWTGLLIEPAINKYLECVANRSARNSIVCAACVSFNYKDQFVPVAYSDYMSAPIGLNSDIDDPVAHARKGEKYLKENEKVFVFGARAVTLNQLLQDAKMPKVIDFLSLDVEGAEMEVLMGIDHKEYRFKYLLIECRNYERLAAYLESVGYSFVEKLSRHDYLFKNE